MIRNAFLAVLIMCAFFLRRTLFTAMTGGALASVPAISKTIPADFPADVPIPKDAKCDLSSKTAGGVQIQLNVKQTPSEVMRFYETELPAQGWAVGQMGDDMKEEPNEEGFVAAKNGHSVSALVVPLQNGTSELTLMVR